MRVAVGEVFLDPVLGDARLGEADGGAKEIEADVPAEDEAAYGGLEDRLGGKELR